MLRRLFVCKQSPSALTTLLKPRTFIVQVSTLLTLQSHSYCGLSAAETHFLEDLSVNRVSCLTLEDKATRFLIHRLTQWFEGFLL
jgi:hypothetical protein